MQKSVDQWMAIYQSYLGKNVDKKSCFAASLSLLQEYAGLISLGSWFAPIESTVAMLNRFFAGSWNHSHAEEVRLVVKMYLDDDSSLYSSSIILSPEARTPGYLIYCIRETIRKSGSSIKAGGDLANIIEVIMQRNNLHERDIKDRTGTLRVPNEAIRYTGRPQ